MKALQLSYGPNQIQTQYLLHHNQVAQKNQPHFLSSIYLVAKAGGLKTILLPLNLEVHLPLN